MVPFRTTSPLPEKTQRRRRRPCSVLPATAAIVLALAADPSPRLVRSAHPPSIKKSAHKHRPKTRGGSVADAAVAAEGVFFGSDYRGSDKGKRNVVVQPDSNPRTTAHVDEGTSSLNYGAYGAGGRDDRNSRPLPEGTFQDVRANMSQQKQRQQQTWQQEQSSELRGKSDWAGERELYGLKQGNIEYYQNGKAMQSSSPSNMAINNYNGNEIGFEKWLNDQHQQTYSQAMRSSSNTVSNNDKSHEMSFEEWISQQQQQTDAQGMQSSFSSNSGTSDSNGNDDERKSISWERLQSHSPARTSSMHVANYKYGSSSTGTSGVENTSEEDFDWLAGQDQWVAQQTAQLSPEFAKSQPRLKLSSLDESDVAGKQVILRPRSENGDSAIADPNPKRVNISPLGSSGASQSKNKEGSQQQQTVVYYYDPKALQSSSWNGENVPELTLPEIVYDSSGHALRLEQVHAGGKNEVFLEVKPKAVWGSDLSSLMNDRLSSIQSKLQFNPISADSSGGAGQQSQDQLIVLFTVATMAVLVGALSAQRLRSKKLLESCMHPELDDDWEVDEFSTTTGSVSATPRYDKKFDVDAGRSATSSNMGSNGGSSGSTGLNSGGGFASLMGGSKGAAGAGYYGTSDNGLHWRGDMEKFDV